MGMEKQNQTYGNDRKKRKITDIKLQDRETKIDTEKKKTEYASRASRDTSQESSNSVPFRVPW